MNLATRPRKLTFACKMSGECELSTLQRFSGRLFPAAKSRDGINSSQTHTHRCDAVCFAATSSSQCEGGAAFLQFNLKCCLAGG